MVVQTIVSLELTFPISSGYRNPALIFGNPFPWVKIALSNLTKKATTEVAVAFSYLL